MQGYCHPIRETDMRARNAVPADIAAKLPDVTGVQFPTLAELKAGQDPSLRIGIQWLA